MEKRLEISLQIESRYLGNIAEGIQEHLRPMLLSHNRDLGGMTLSFHDVKPVSAMAKILYENPGVFVKVSATLLLFAPQPGEILVGRINFVGHDHIGLTVYNTVKASITRACFPEAYSLRAAGDGKPAQWCEPGKPDTELVVGREVIFAMSKLETAADGLPVVTGTMRGGNGRLGPTASPLEMPPEPEEPEAEWTVQESQPPAKKIKSEAAAGFGSSTSAAGASKAAKKTKGNSVSIGAEQLEQKMLAENGGAPLTHKQIRLLKKEKKKEAAKAKADAGAMSNEASKQEPAGGED